VRWLVGFAKVEALAGAEVTADIAIPLRCLAHWDTAAGRWTVEPGEYQLSVGRSSRDLSLSVAVTIGPDAMMSGEAPRCRPEDRSGRC
jgi:beta-glucosidase